MSESERDRLDQALDGLPREVPLSRDLWPQIRAQIEPQRIEHQRIDPRRTWSRRRRWPGPGWLQLAAGVLLVVASSATTYVLTRQSARPAAQVAGQAMPAPALQATPASYSFGQERLGAGYLRARAELDEMFQRRLATLPPAARAKLERNLADLRHAAGQISATLAEHPSDPLLQELLMSTYQSELNLLADVDQMTIASSTRADL